MASKLSEPSTAIVGYIRLKPPAVPISTSVITNPAASAKKKRAPTMISPSQGISSTSPATTATISPIPSTMISGIIGAEINERNLETANESPCRTDSFRPSSATWTAAIRAIAPPKSDQTTRNNAPNSRK